MAEELIKIGEVAARLSLSSKGVRSLMESRVIPFLRLNTRVLRFKWSEVEKALNRHTTKEIS